MKRRSENTPGLFRPVHGGTWEPATTGTESGRATSNREPKPPAPPKPPPPEVCPHCGAKVVQYRHRMNANLVTGLMRLYEAGGRANLKALGLTRNQWDNFQKLRYWGLVKRSMNQDGTRARGVWEITSTGAAFLESRHGVRDTAVTYRGEPTRTEGHLVTIRELMPTGYDKVEYYARNATGGAP